MPYQPPSFQNRGPPPALPYEAASQNHPPSVKVNLEELIVRFMSATDNRMNTIEAAQRNYEASIRNLEQQIRQLVKIVSKNTPGALPSNIEVNPREHMNAISLTIDEEIPTAKKETIVQEENCNEKEEQSSNIFEVKEVELEKDVEIKRRMKDKGS